MAKRSNAQRLKLKREVVFGADEFRFFDRNKEPGWAVVPRTLPLVMRAIREGSSSSFDCRMVYFELWSHATDEGIVEVKDESSHAYNSGLGGKGRASKSWRERVLELENLGFVRVGKNVFDKISFIFLIHPTIAVKNLVDVQKNNKNLQRLWMVYQEKISEIGAYTHEQVLKSIENKKNNYDTSDTDDL